MGGEEYFGFSRVVIIVIAQATARSLTGISGKWEALTRSTNSLRRCPESRTLVPLPVWTYRETAQWLLQV